MNKDSTAAAITDVPKPTILRMRARGQSRVLQPRDVPKFTHVPGPSPNPTSYHITKLAAVRSLDVWIQRKFSDDCVSAGAHGSSSPGERAARTHNDCGLLAKMARETPGNEQQQKSPPQESLAGKICACC